MMDTHFVPYDEARSIGGWRALCGEYVDKPLQAARPTCRPCLTALADDTHQLDDLIAGPVSPSLALAPEPFDAEPEPPDPTPVPAEPAPDPPAPAPAVMKGRLVDAAARFQPPALDDPPATEAVLVTSIERAAETAAAIRESETIVEAATALQVSNPDTCIQGEELYASICAVEKKIHDHYDSHCDRAHATWKGLTDERGRYLRPIEAIKKILGQRVADWKLARKREEEKAQRDAEARARQEQLEAAAREAAQLVEQGEPDAAAAVVEEARTAPTPALPTRPSMVPSTGRTVTKGVWTAVVTDWTALRAAIGAGVLPEFDEAILKAVQPLLNRQATVLKGSLASKYPGTEGREQGRLASR